MIEPEQAAAAAAAAAAAEILARGHRGYWTEKMAPATPAAVAEPSGAALIEAVERV